MEGHNKLLRQAGLVFLIALIIRVLFALPVFAHPARAVLADSISYWGASDSVLQGIYPHGLRPPGYPALIALCRLLWDDLRLPITVNILLDSGTALLVWFGAKRLFEQARFALLSGLFYALMPGPVFYSSKLMSETGFTFFLALSLVLVLIYKPLASGMSAAAAQFFRPVGWVMAGFNAVFLLVKRRFSQAGLLLGVFFLLTGSWMFRNWLKTGSFVFSTAAPAQLISNWTYFALAKKMPKDSIGPYLDQQLSQEMGRSTTVRLEADNPKAAFSMFKVASRIIVSNPKQVFFFWVVAGMATVLGPPVSARVLTYHMTGQVLSTEADPIQTAKPGKVIKHFMSRLDHMPLRASSAWLLMWVFNLMLLAAAMVGLLRQPSFEKWWLALFVLVMVLGPGPATYERFMVPAAPVLALLAGGCFEKRRKVS